MSTKTETKRLNEAQSVIDVLSIIAPLKYKPRVELRGDSGRGTKASACSWSNTIIIYESFYKNGICDLWISGYPKENKFTKGHINSFNDYKNWVLVHEYVHMLNPDLGHTNVFFNKVELLFIKYKKYLKNVR